MNKTGKKLNQIIYEVLKGHLFCRCAVKNKEIYDAWCLRIVETVDMYLEKKNNG